MDTLNKLKQYDSIIPFYNLAIDLCRRRGIKYNFKCPLCGGKAHVTKTTRNGPIRASCESCGIKIDD